MKKILFTVSTILFVLISCSDNEQETDSTNTHSSSRVIPEADLRVLYENMVNSTDYKNLDLAEEQYWNKMSYTGDGSDLENGGLGWIAANLSHTGFTTLSEAENEYENILTLTGIVAASNTEFFAAFGDEGNHHTLTLIMNPPPTTTEDPCGCNSANTACKNGVENKYQKAMALANDAKPVVSSKAYNKMVSDAKNGKRFGLGICSQSLTYCLDGCDEI
jgi:hypothetical protein